MLQEAGVLVECREFVQGMLAYHGIMDRLPKNPIVVTIYQSVHDETERINLGRKQARDIRQKSWIARTVVCDEDPHARMR